MRLKDKINIKIEGNEKNRSEIIYDNLLEQLDTKDAKIEYDSLAEFLKVEAINKIKENDKIRIDTKGIKADIKDLQKKRTGMKYQVRFFCSINYAIFLIAFRVLFGIFYLSSLWFLLDKNKITLCVRISRDCCLYLAVEKHFVIVL